MAQLSAIRFDPHRQTINEQISTAIKNFIDHLIAEESRLAQRKRARKPNDLRHFKLAVTSLACNLLVNAMALPATALSIPRGHAAMWSRGRYGNPIFGQHFLDAVDLMETLGLINRVTRGYRFSARQSQPTTILPTDALGDHLPFGKTKWTDFSYDGQIELIVLKPPKDVNGLAEPIEYVDTRNTKRWRREIHFINEKLRVAPISLLEGNPHAIRLDKDGQPIESYRRSLRRVFNNGDWNAGGRLFGGFWMTMERMERFRTIRIGGEDIANVDFSSLFPRMAYVRAQQEQPDFDLYDVTGDNTCRDGWKMLINALLFTQRRLKGWPTGARKKFRQGTKLSSVVSDIKSKHAPIATLFEKGYGFQLMRHESDMLVCIVTTLLKSGITALPLHDSVLVAQSKAEQARDLMEQEFMHRTGSSRAFVKIDKGYI